MIIIKTKYKMLIASILQLPIILFFKIFKKSTKIFVVRNEINWLIDLNEGIDFSIFLTGRFEYDISSFIKQNVSKNDIVFDIGANIGAHTLPAAKYLGDNGVIHAFEPTKYAYDKLNKNISLNPKFSDRIKVNQILLTDNKKNHVSALYSSWSLDTKKQKHKKHQGNLRSTKGCKIMTLDQYIFQNKIQNVKLIKIDVDGFEIEVLEGGKIFFQTQKPTILIELAPYTFEERGKSFSSLISLLKKMNYELYLIKKPIRLPFNHALIEKMIPEGGSINVVGKHLENH